MPKIKHKDLPDFMDGNCCFLSKGILRSKDPCWEYENEIRLIAKDGMESPFIDLEPKAIIVGIKDSPEWAVFSAVSNQFNIPFGYLENRPDGMPGYVVKSEKSFFDYLTK